MRVHALRAEPDGLALDSAGGLGDIVMVPSVRLWLVGYGDWTGYASATLIEVGRSARQTVEEIQG